MEIRRLVRDDLEQAWELDSDAFHAPPEAKARFLGWQDPDGFVGAFDAGRLVAMANAHDFGQFFGGRSVRMGGLASVAVAPDRRGEGLAARVVGAGLDAMPERGFAISSLFPATTRLYRGLGWELAGSHVWRRIAPRALQSLPRPEGVRTRAVDAGETGAIRAGYERLAPQINGFVDRSDRWWEGLRRWIFPARSLFVAERDGEVVGHLSYRQVDGDYTGLGGPFRIAVEELFWNERDAGLALWRLVGSWASQVSEVIYRSGPEDPLWLLASEQESEPLAGIRWMTRIVDLDAAVAQRGFHAGIELEAPFELSDPRFAANDGAFVLLVSKGRGRVERGGSGGPRLDVGAFSSLYTGWATCAALARAGRLVGGRPEDRERLDAAFAGPTPWTLEEF